MEMIQLATTFSLITLTMATQKSTMMLGKTRFPKLSTTKFIVHRSSVALCELNS